MSASDAHGSAEQMGYAFACFRAHALQTPGSGEWLVPGFHFERDQTNRGDCECGAGYDVSDEYHWHETYGSNKCHNRVKCV